MRRMTGWISGCAFLLVAAKGFAADDLAKNFAQPPESAKPQVWWHWMNGNITREGIHADLEAMKRVGLGGASIFSVSSGIPEGPVDFMSDEWRSLFKYAVQEADRLGLKLAVHNSDSWSGSGGPWISASNSMQVLVGCESRISGPGRVSKKLPMPPVTRTAGPEVELPIDPFYSDIAVLAFKGPPDAGRPMQDFSPVISGGDAQSDLAKLVDGNPESGTTLPPLVKGQTQFVQFEFKEPFVAQALTLQTQPGAGRQQHGGQLMISQDGSTYNPVANFTIPYGGGGFGGGGDSTTLALTFPATTSKWWRVVFNRSGFSAGRRMELAEITLLPEQRIPNWWARSGHVWTDSPLKTDWTAPASACIPHSGIVNLTDKLSADGTLTWDAPEGDWIVLRLGHTSAGKANAPATPKGLGLECDKMNRLAADLHYDSFLKKILGDIGPLAGKVLTGTVIDSWELGAQSWTPEFCMEFSSRRGYDPLPYLPATQGFIVDSPEVSERFLRDFRRTCADLMADNYVAQLQKRAYQDGLTFGMEAYGAGNFDMFQCSALADIPMAEFWFRGEFKPGEGKFVPSAAHAAGRKVVAAEAFTASQENAGWQVHPFLTKAVGDTMFADGINRMVIHSWPMQPWTDRVPGMTMGPWGICYTRNTTWFEQSRAWLSYLARCQYLLQEGTFVADYAVFAGEDVHNERHGLAHPDASFPVGYDYDYLNDHALYSATIKDGRITLPSGMSYRLLVLPNSRFITPELARKLRELAEQGALIAGRKPEKSPSLTGYPDCDQEVRSIAREVWGGVDGKAVRERAFGKGRIYDRTGVADILAADGLTPDIQWTQGNLVWQHRRIGTDEVYFVANQEINALSTELSLRISGKVPELWHPDSGTIETAGVWRVENGRTVVPLNLNPCESLFVVFRRAGAPVVTALSGGNAEIRMTSRGPELLARSNGNYEVTTAAGKKTVAVTSVPKAVAIDGPWKVMFQAGRGAPESANFEKLISWTDHADEGIKYFSGTAAYSREIEVPSGLLSGSTEVSLDLGIVDVIAEVFVNGQDAGIWWRPPFRADVTRFLNPGKNRLEIRVTNLWPNRLIGDESKPSYLTRWIGGKMPGEWPDSIVKGPLPDTGRVTFTTWRHYTKDSPLVPSGLLGPVTLQCSVRVLVE